LISRRITIKLSAVGERDDAERSRAARRTRRATSWLPVVGLFAFLAAIYLDAPYGLINALLVVALVALAVEAIFLIVAYNRDKQHR